MPIPIQFTLITEIVVLTKTTLLIKFTELKSLIRQLEIGLMARTLGTNVRSTKLSAMPTVLPLWTEILLFILQILPVTQLLAYLLEVCVYSPKQL